VVACRPSLHDERLPGVPSGASRRLSLSWGRKGGAPAGAPPFRCHGELSKASRPGMAEDLLVVLDAGRRLRRVALGRGVVPLAP